MKSLTPRRSGASVAASLPAPALGLAGLLALALALSLPPPARAAEPRAVSAEEPVSATKVETIKKPIPAVITGKDIARQVREAVSSGDLSKKRLTLVINDKEEIVPAAGPTAAAAHEGPAKAAAPATHKPASAAYVRARPVAAVKIVAPVEARPHEIHWSYEGEGGPQAWGNLKPEYSTCANGKRQSPIHIEESMTLQGPAEPILFNYQPSSGTVINNGHTIQVDVYGDNTITVRGSTYKLLQFHFHHPSEERVNYKSYEMVAHLVHRNAEGQLAVIGVLLDPGVANALINKVWTYMPLDSGDKVRTPDALLDLNELLPQDQRYYQFLGSLTTPPCTEGVLWMVLKQPVTLSREQIKLFGQLYPSNARPVQAVNGRPIRDAQ
jgi:carbonic anhydrase